MKFYLIPLSLTFFSYFSLNGQSDYLLEYWSIINVSDTIQVADTVVYTIEIIDSTQESFSRDSTASSYK